MPDNPQPNRPASGSYGEKKAVEDLRRSLPTAGGPSPRPVEQASLSVPDGGERGLPGRPLGTTPPPGVPPAILQGPDLPVPAQPVAAPPVPQSRAEYVLMVLDVLQHSPETTDETKEWAGTVKEYLIAASR